MTEGNVPVDSLILAWKEAALLLFCWIFFLVFLAHFLLAEMNCNVL